MFIKNLDKNKWLKRERVHINSITGTNSQLCYMHLEYGEKTDHHHPHEQIGYILEGSVLLTIDGKTEILYPGDGYLIPSHVQHGFEVIEESGLTFLETFSPVKTENINPQDRK